ncbi:MAG TPA: serine protease [Flavobacteriaceae bacterium]|nr:serine protease [Flavobacteriaceae bacterium]
MKNHIIIIFIILSINFAFSQNNGVFGNKEMTLKRITKLKESTGKILVDNQKSGTGFFISSNGFLLTNWHVIFNKETKIDSTGKIKSNFFFVNFKNDTIPLDIVLNISNEAVVKNAINWDYCILKVTKEIKTNFLKLGNYSTAYEGASVYTCGFPLNLNEPFISTGIISSFFTQTINEKKNIKRNVAWLDMTTNKGNSGGPLILLSDKPENDEVIGITSFITTPYYNILESLNQYVEEAEKKGSIGLMGIDFLSYIKLINTTANSNSVGISGCISIENVKPIVAEINK